MVTSAGGTGWWTAASARDKALADLTAERSVSGQLRTAVQLQNAAVESAGAAKLAADDRGAAAQKLAAASARRFDAALARVAGARATTCDEAMPAVNVILESVR
ncbi:hypothetical protein BN2497_13609 [Janthinobacterium sp. CG23_2]|nr:hypothetical protein BN2497_13609 [Janthinobacterium sp. CG23_2]CUU33202.1 hypothetical protein BN3177_13609 [Janthinobacterium sp. CG23_2]